MRTERSTWVIITSFFLVFCSFVYLYQDHIVTGVHKKLTEHAKVIAPSLWDYDKIHTLQYLTVTAGAYNYASLAVIEDGGEIDITVAGPTPEKFEQWLIKIKLIPLYTFEQDITYSGQKIGRLQVIWRCTTIYTYIYIAICLLLAGIGVWLFVRLLSGNRLLALAKEKAETAQRVSEAANLAKSTFLANMSHELRTPLNAILGFSQLMTHDPLISADQLNKLSIINRSGEHLLMLINDVLDMSKIEAGQATLEFSGFELRRTLATVEEMSAGRAEVKQLNFKVEYPTHLPIYIKTDERKLRQVLLNLLSNAIKFTEVGEVILRVSSLAPQKNADSSMVHLQFEVEDTGPGISQNELENIFDPFIQTDTGQQCQQEGTGLGLAISRQFIRLMHGDISVSSTIGKGSLFTFDIRVEAADIGQLEQQHAQRQVIGISSTITTIYRILIVDDNVLNRSLLSELLIPVGFEMREAVNGQEAVEIALEWQPHFIWMDMRMPVMDGYAATQAIRRLSSPVNTVPIIALTASAFEENREQMLIAGCDDFMRKPFKTHELFDKMAEYLEIKYLYEKEVVPVLKTQASEHEKMGLKVFAAFSPDILNSLEEAAVSGNLEMIEEVTEKIREVNNKYDEIANNILEMAKNFKYKELWTMIQQTKGA